ncbi:MAG: SsrA-binding protein, partial [Patescibacteria group bacterium]
YNQHRERKLLMKRQEISHLLGKKQAEGLTLIPLKLYTNHSFLKLEFAVAKGKKKYDKRDSIKKRDVDRQIRSLTKRK